MNLENKIDVTDLDIKALIKGAYDLSAPVGMGIMHYEEGTLSDDEIAEIIIGTFSGPIIMDYVKGRCCKFKIFEHDGRIYINDTWLDHSKEQLDELLRRAGSKIVSNEIHENLTIYDFEMIMKRISISELYPQLIEISEVKSLNIGFRSTYNILRMTESAVNEFDLFGDDADNVIKFIRKCMDKASIATREE